jgi:hypothetical protein
VVEKPYIDQLIEDFGSEFVVSTVVAAGAALLTMMVIEWSSFERYESQLGVCDCCSLYGLVWRVCDPFSESHYQK